VTEQNIRYAEDYKPGDVFALGAYDVTRDEIIEFSRKYDPFPFHVDDEAARAMLLGRKTAYVSAETRPRIWTSALGRSRRDTPKRIRIPR